MLPLLRSPRQTMAKCVKAQEAPLPDRAAKSR